MNYSYVARQPILDKNRETVGYELLFRDGPNNTFPEVEAEYATSRLLTDHMLTTHYKTLDGKLGFVNFPYQSIVKQIPTLFPNDSLIVEILEGCEPTDELFEAVKKLSVQGYKLALDDFIPKPEWKRFLPYISIIKFDIRQIPLEKAAVFIQKLQGSKIRFIAEKVETYQEFSQAKNAGFDWFQGYFFSKPEMMKNSAISPLYITVSQMLQEVSSNPVDFGKLERIITADVSLSYKLLKYVNNVTHLANEIKSFHQALVYLGEEQLRRFISLLAIANTNTGKPSSLYALSVQRAFFCEELCIKHLPNIEVGQAFIMGMFSLLDSILDQPLEDLLNTIAIDNDVYKALLCNQGTLGKLLALTKAYEKADWSCVMSLSEELGISGHTLSRSYADAVAWSESVLAVR
ncbi:EAL and HDOD domain-containing protein [Vibrio maerlii]|uniref:EAL and HDOD domain-containing protein n=1 Tax=Vibrio maerlii TaxID=2231648 RepID=UPI000E3CF0A1|nr:HDOD domain-containing protein [Vibrio maerlii]